MSALALNLRRQGSDPTSAQDPTRPLATATIVNTFGNGLFLTVSVIYLTRFVSLSALQVSLGLTLAGLVGVCGAIPFGHLSDRVGAKPLYIGLLAAEGASVAALVLVDSIATFAAVACVMAFLHEGGLAVRLAMLAQVGTDEVRLHIRAYIRAVASAGVALGSLAAAAGLILDSRAAFITLILLDALTCLLSAALISQVPVNDPPRRHRQSESLVAIRDFPYLSVTAVDSVLAFHYGLLEVGMPLWISQKTDAPTWMVAALFFINTIVCVLLQVRASRGTEAIPKAARASRYAGYLLAASCLTFALTGGSLDLVAVIALLVVAGTLESFGEIMQSAGSWGLGFGLAPDRIQGQYQGVFATGTSLGVTLSPMIVTLAVIQLGTPGWILLAAMFAGAGLLMTVLARAADGREFPAPRR